jgi:hypothetical protein
MKNQYQIIYFKRTGCIHCSNFEKISHEFIKKEFEENSNLAFAVIDLDLESRKELVSFLEDTLKINVIATPMIFFIQNNTVLESLTMIGNNFDKLQDSTKIFINMINKDKGLSSPSYNMCGFFGVNNKDSILKNNIYAALQNSLSYNERSKIISIKQKIENINVKSNNLKNTTKIDKDNKKINQNIEPYINENKTNKEKFLDFYRGIREFFRNIYNAILSFIKKSISSIVNLVSFQRSECPNSALNK